jgi:hypothetical protein
LEPSKKFKVVDKKEIETYLDSLSDPNAQLEKMNKFKFLSLHSGTFIYKKGGKKTNRVGRTYDQTIIQPAAITDIGIIENSIYDHVAKQLIEQYGEEHILKLLIKEVREQHKYLVHKATDSVVRHEAFLLHMRRIFECTNWISYHEFNTKLRKEIK